MQFRTTLQCMLGNRRGRRGLSLSFPVGYAQHVERTLRELPIHELMANREFPELAPTLFRAEKFQRLATFVGVSEVGRNAPDNYLLRAPLKTDDLAVLGGDRLGRRQHALVALAESLATLGEVLLAHLNYDSRIH